MATPINRIDLPKSSASTLQLVQPTETELIETTTLGAVDWKGPIDTSAYLRREDHIRDQTLTRHGGITFWILVDTTAPLTSTGSRTILASCETIRKRALVAWPDEGVREVITHGIASVHCNPAYRGKGFARRMMIELAHHLDTWQQKDGENADFTVLWSDIGKQFYARLGWKTYPSTHIALCPRSNGEKDLSLPGASLLAADDIVDLCSKGEATLRSDLAKPYTLASTVRVALKPDAATMQWHHAREEFLAQLVLGKQPTCKGAMAKTPDGEKAWCIWTRTFGASQDENVLNILRLGVEHNEDDVDLQEPNAVNDGDQNASGQALVEAIAAILQAARVEAAAWGMSIVHLWNPSQMSILAARKVDRSARIIDRNDESLPSLRWHGKALPDGMEIDWIGNEKYGWC
ncbi:MAG: hypothetical protein Q9186_002299 [Xanthomendoza sp. 1 TL-2023]